VGVVERKCFFRITLDPNVRFWSFLAHSNRIIMGYKEINI
jgi:hypothetical protein